MHKNSEDNHEKVGTASPYFSCPFIIIDKMEPNTLAVLLIWVGIISFALVLTRLLIIPLECMINRFAYTTI